MRKAEFNKAQVIRYLIWTFALAYGIQIGAAYLYSHVNKMIGQLVIAAMMFVPTLGVLLAGAKLKGMGWRPQIRKNVGPILFAWFAPIVLSVAGAALYFLVFPGHFDLSGEYLTASAGPEVLEQMKAEGLTYRAYVLIPAVCSCT